MRHAPLLVPALLVIALLLAAGCQDVSFGSTKMGDFGDSPEEQAVVNDLIKKYGNPMDKGDPRFLESLVTTKLSEKLVPVDKVTVFSKDVPSVWFWAMYDNFEKGDALTLTWTYLDQGKDLLSVNRQCTGEFGRAYGEFVKPDKGWPLGNHRITISGRGITASADFQIQEGATQTVPLPWPAGIEVNVTTLPAGQQPAAPVSCFAVRMNRTSAPVLATMNADCSEGEIRVYAWDFGDGTPVAVYRGGDTGMEVIHGYRFEGGYRIILNVTDSRNRTVASYQKMYVSGPLSESGTCTGQGPGFTVCMGNCTNLETDPRNCGWCNSRCPGTACIAGTCEERAYFPSLYFDARAEVSNITIHYGGGQDVSRVESVLLTVDSSDGKHHEQYWQSPQVGSYWWLTGANTPGVDVVKVQVYIPPSTYTVLDTQL
ncbi:MAG: PKD domain-containing protein [Methanomicrobiales archaeon]|nr:PKD domain-containing protein [Methanomicrobiales archaeon]